MPKNKMTITIFEDDDGRVQVWQKGQASASSFVSVIASEMMLVVLLPRDDDDEEEIERFEKEVIH
jgi:hypothetical protein